MTVRGHVVRVAVMLGLVSVVQTLGCECNCDGLEAIPLEAGQYEVTRIMYDNSDSAWMGHDPEELIGGEFEIEPEAEFATLRYTRDGTTYEVRFVIEQGD